MGKERIKAGESWPEKKKKKTLRSIRRVEIELQSGRKEISEGRCGRFRCNDAPGGEGGCTVVAARDLEGTRNRGSVPKRDPLMRTRSTV